MSISLHSGPFASIRVHLLPFGSIRGWTVFALSNLYASTWAARELGKSFCSGNTLLGRGRSGTESLPFFFGQGLLSERGAGRFGWGGGRGLGAKGFGELCALTHM